MSVRNVVPTLTSNERWDQPLDGPVLATKDTGFILVLAGAVRQQWCARGTVLRCTVVLVEGGYKRGGRGGRASKSKRY
jgi:hypothetical protein